MGLVKTRNWIDQYWKIPLIGTVLIIIGIITPPTAVMESGISIFLWYFGFWFVSSELIVDFGFPCFFIV